MNSFHDDSRKRKQKPAPSTFVSSGPSKRPKKKSSTFKSVGKRAPELAGEDRVERVPSSQARIYAATAGFVIGMTLGSLAFRFLGFVVFFPGDLMWTLGLTGAIVGFFPGPYWIDKAIQKGWWF